MTELNKYFNLTEPLLREIIDRTLKDKSLREREDLSQEMAWAIHPDNPKFTKFVKYFEEVPYE